MWAEAQFDTKVSTNAGPFDATCREKTRLHCAPATAGASPSIAFFSSFPPPVELWLWL